MFSPPPPPPPPPLPPPPAPPPAVTVGFTVENVTVMESAGQVNVCLAVTGQREIPVVVRVTTPTTPEVTATGESAWSSLQCIHELLQ